MPAVTEQSARPDCNNQGHFFEPATGGFRKEFYRPVSQQSAMNSCGVPDVQTIVWWSEQSDEA
ncbi:3'-5' exoribonuclease domain-containing protein [Pectobacterium punjabense]|uniref:3'-5' exoribonuclease domain-containing protein n=1 Tax=Pectobacterium punjabense TaxID=2108399 RepID=UPI003D9B156A